jgi:hypothetical protein
MYYILKEGRTIKHFGGRPKWKDLPETGRLVAAEPAKKDVGEVVPTCPVLLKAFGTYLGVSLCVFF